MTKLLCPLAILLLSFTLACSKANAPEAPKPSAANQSASSAPVAMKVDLKVDPAEPNPSKPAKFTVRLTDPDGKPVTGASVDISLVMKTMDMGKNEFKLADKGNGDYAGEGKFGMAGDWNAVVTAKEPGKSATQSFPVKSIMPKP